jgi:hypothetical protein
MQLKTLCLQRKSSKSLTRNKTTMKTAKVFTRLNDSQKFNQSENRMPFPGKQACKANDILNPNQAYPSDVCRTRWFSFLVALMLLASFFQGADALAARLYVNASATGANNGNN